MNKYVHRLLGVMFQGQQTQQVVHISSQLLPIYPKEWRAHWQAKGFPWRTKPEIDEKRQEELAKCRTVVPDIEKGIYPFKGMNLSRADVEWLLATYGFVAPQDACIPILRKLNQRDGLDLRGANLRRVDLTELPLSHILGGLDWTNEYLMHSLSREQFDMAAVHLEEGWLIGTHLDGAILGGAHLERANLTKAYLRGVDLSEAELESANLFGASLQGAYLEFTNLRKTNLTSADLRGTHLVRARLEEATLWNAHLEGANLREAHLEGANLQNINLEGANLTKAHLEGADLKQASLKGKVVPESDWEQVRKWAPFSNHELAPAHLQSAFFDAATNLEKAILGEKKHGFVSIADVQWGDVNLLVVDWSQVNQLGDEYEALQKRYLNDYQAAVRANRQLAVVLEDQGLNEDASRFAYRAQILQRKVLWKQRNFWKWSGSAMLALLAGYGYRMWRIIVAYLFVILICAGAYFVLGVYYEPHLSFPDAVLTSVTAFHGRVFSEPFLHSGTPQLWVTAFEAVAGLIIEGVFIAMLTQKFFGK
jgi:uncharacterized protein YjbI with pentapeptide repeats